MEVFVLIFMIALPAFFFLFANRFKGIMALVMIAPIVMINIIGLSLNSGFDQNNPPVLEYTHQVIGNTTATTVGNVTTTVNVYVDVTDKYPIGFQNMVIFNGLLSTFTLVMLFVVWRRITTEQTEPSDR